jgi:N-formylglutamate amidohydrolase
MRDPVNKAAVIHIPHASATIPASERASLTISDEALRLELLRMTDWYTDELVDLGEEVASTLVFPISRLVVDPERFADDSVEPMARKGMGAVYTRTSDGRPLRSSLDAAERQRLVEQYYFPHHERLAALVTEALSNSGQCLLIDAHSFPSSPLPCDLDQTPLRPDICIGTDSFHTPAWLGDAALSAFRARGWRVALDRPYAGSIVPMRYHRQDARVASVMVEMNRSLYMDEATGERLPEFPEIGTKVQSALKTLIEAFWRRARASS